jgi:hypothetical protein
MALVLVRGDGLVDHLRLGATAQVMADGSQADLNRFDRSRRRGPRQVR